MAEAAKVIPNTPAMRALVADAMLNVARIVAPPGSTLRLQHLKGDAFLKREVAPTAGLYQPGGSA
jgi:hypothetical protein